MTEVHKFGGGCLRDAAALRQMAHIVNRYFNGPTVIVVSAFGKTTDQLTYIANASKYELKHVNQEFSQVRKFHKKIIDELFGEENKRITLEFDEIMNSLDQSIVDIKKYKDVALAVDQITPIGEILSSKIVSRYLKHKGINNVFSYAGDFIRTDTNFGQANVCKEKTKILLKKCLSPQLSKNGQMVVTQGFIGRTSLSIPYVLNYEFSTTLGREGSDYTAGLIANLLGVKKVVLWKDVPGIMNINPKSHGGEKAVLLSDISYHKCAQLLATTANGLIHQRTLNEVMEGGIPLYIKDFWHPDNEGTVVH